MLWYVLDEAKVLVYVENANAPPVLLRQVVITCEIFHGAAGPAVPCLLCIGEQLIEQEAEGAAGGARYVREEDDIFEGIEHRLNLCNGHPCARISIK